MTMGLTRVLYIKSLPFMQFPLPVKDSDKYFYYYTNVCVALTTKGWIKNPFNPPSFSDSIFMQYEQLLLLNVSVCHKSPEIPT